MHLRMGNKRRLWVKGTGLGRGPGPEERGWQGILALCCLSEKQPGSRCEVRAVF